MLLGIDDQPCNTPCHRNESNYYAMNYLEIRKELKTGTRREVTMRRILASWSTSFPTVADLGDTFPPSRCSPTGSTLRIHGRMRPRPDTRSTTIPLCDLRWREILPDPHCGLFSDDLRKLLGCGKPHALHRAKRLEELFRALLPNSCDEIKFGLQCATSAEGTVKADRKPVCLVPRLLQQAERW